MEISHTWGLKLHIIGAGPTKFWLYLGPNRKFVTLYMSAWGRGLEKTGFRTSAPGAERLYIYMNILPPLIAQLSALLALILFCETTSHKMRIITLFFPFRHMFIVKCSGLINKTRGLQLILWYQLFS